MRNLIRQMNGQSQDVIARRPKASVAISKMRDCFVASLLAMTALFTLPLAHAAFQDPYWSARAAALGGAYSAIADDAAGIFYNPAAGLGRIKRKESSFSYARLLTGMDEVKLSLYQLSYVQPIWPLALLGVGWGNFTATDLYKEDTMALTFARSLKDVLPRAGGELGVGFSLKYLMKGYSPNARSAGDPIFRDGTTAKNVAFDLHAFSVPSPTFLPGLSLSLSLKNINRPNLGLGEKDELPMEVVGGLAYQWKNLSFPMSLPVNLASQRGKILPRMGCEAWFADRKIALRIGGDKDLIGTGFGYQHDFRQKLAVVFDYAFLMPFKMGDTAGSHRASLGFKFK